MLLKKFITISLILTLTISSACITSNKKTVSTSKHAKKTKKYRHVEVATEKRTSPATPLINDGIDKLKNQLNSEAEWKFEEAINLDPDYGPAYYWLARARYRLEEIQKALDLLDKAKSLLKNSENWLQRIEKFRNFLLDQLN